jgi:uncharacterized protein (TIGR04255 family)
MAPFDTVLYKRTFLKQVIARIDFANPLPNINTALPADLTRATLERFPISEPRKGVAREFQISPQALSTKQSEFVQWQFHGREREKTFTIEPGATLIEQRSYKTFEDLREDFVTLVMKLFGSFKDVQPSRLGLRYINAIELKEGEPLDWSTFLNPHMLSVFEFIPQSERQFLTRVFHNLELAYDDVSLRYQFGMHNPDYPARIKQKTFVLDLDAYVQGAIDRDAIGTVLDACHACIQEHFERSITDRLRGLLNA